VIDSVKGYSGLLPLSNDLWLVADWRKTVPATGLADDSDVLTVNS
jgi:hypothetical protein